MSISRLKQKQEGLLVKVLLFSFSLILSFVFSSAHAGELKEIILKDGSVLTGEVVSLTNGIYTITSESLGTIKLEESKVRAIQERASSPSLTTSPVNNITAGEITSLQEKMVRDKEIMSMIQSLQNDPEFKKLLEDPKIMNAVNTGDVAALTADPRFMKLLSNPTVQKIQKKVK
jgi:hypothetical protein